jgi:hypothetical protein
MSEIVDCRAAGIELDFPGVDGDKRLFLSGQRVKKIDHG